MADDAKRGGAKGGARPGSLNEWWSRWRTRIPEREREVADRELRLICQNLKLGQEHSLALVLRTKEAADSAHASAITGIETMARALAEPITQAIRSMQENIERIGDQVAEVAARQEKEESERKDFLKDVLEKHEEVVRLVYGKKCPCCRTVEIIDQNGRLKTAFGHKEHMYDAGMRGLEQTWLVCTTCHLLKKSDTAKFRVRFENYQHDLSEHLKGRGPAPYPQGSLLAR